MTKYSNNQTFRFFIFWFFDKGDCKKEDDLKNKDGLKNEVDLKNEDNLKKKTTLEIMTTPKIKTTSKMRTTLNMNEDDLKHVYNLIYKTVSGQSLLYHAWLPAFITFGLIFIF